MLFSDLFHHLLIDVLRDQRLKGLGGRQRIGSKRSDHSALLVDLV
jgi:hypothetical protein